MQVEDALRALGGVARWKQLRGHVGWRAIKHARRDGRVEFRDGAYHLTGTGQDRVAAGRLRGVRSHSTAAEHWGLAVPPTGRIIVLTVPSNAHRDNIPADVRLRYRDLHPDEVDGDVTTPLQTAVDCLRDEPLRVALSVGDSALREEMVAHDQLEVALRGRGGPRSALGLRRLAMLDARAANAFESSGRAILLEAGIAGFEPQVTIRHAGQWVGRVDLAHRALRIVVECDGFETHGGKEAFVKDLVRFTLLVSGGWRPLRFTWEQVMFRPEWVLERVRDVLGEASGAFLEEKGGTRPWRPAA